jgi:cytochrome P450
VQSAQGRIRKHAQTILTQAVFIKEYKMKIPRKTAKPTTRPVIVIVEKVEMARDILRSGNFIHPLRVVETLMGRLGGDSPVLSVAYGETWEHTHDAVARFFNSHSVSNYVPGINKIARETFAAIAERASSHPDGKVTINLEACMRQLTARIMGHVLFGEALPPNEAEMVDREIGIMGSPPAPNAIRITLPEHRRAVNNVARLVRKKIKEHISAEKFLAPQVNLEMPATLLESLVNRFMEFGPSKRNKALVTEIIFFMVAGIETTASSLALTIAKIAKHPEVMERMVAEALSARAAEDGRILRPEALPYALWTFSEGLRHHAVAGVISRQSKIDDKIYVISPRRFHKKLTVWPDPKTFEPGRFSNLTPEQRAHLWAFGWGKRACLGRDLAMAEGTIVLGQLFGHLILEKLDGPQEPSKIDIMNIEQAGPMPATVRSRSAGSSPEVAG